MTITAFFLLKPHCLTLPLSKPAIWAVVLMRYPFLAARPQEIRFRCFCFHRYRRLFPHPALMVTARAASFGWGHRCYGNWVAPTLSSPEGLLFGWRYLKIRSLLAVGSEHALGGNFLYTVGIGWFFFSGSIR